MMILSKSRHWLQFTPPKSWLDWEQRFPHHAAAIFLGLSVLINLLHYAFGEWITYPQIAILKEPNFWSGTIGFIIFPVIQWFILIFFLQRKTIAARAILFFSIFIGVGDLIWYLAALNWKLFEKILYRDYWWWWTCWFPCLAIVWNISVFFQWQKSAGGPIARVRKSLATVFTRSRSLQQRLALAACLILPCLLLGYHGLRALKIEERTAILANYILLPSDEIDDFNYLIKRVDGRKTSLGAMVDNVKLAQSERQHFYPAIDDITFRQFVLSPHISALPINEYAWRKPLWKRLTPEVRGEQDILSAARIVANSLRLWITIDPGQSYRVGIETILKQRLTDHVGFAQVYVAGLRSVGIAARLNGEAQVELWTGREWLFAPSPPSLSMETVAAK